MPTLSLFSSAACRSTSIDIYALSYIYPHMKVELEREEMETKEAVTAIACHDTISVSYTHLTLPTILLV